MYEINYANKTYLKIKNQPHTSFKRKRGLNDFLPDSVKLDLGTEVTPPLLDFVHEVVVVLCKDSAQLIINLECKLKA